MMRSLLISLFFLCAELCGSAAEKNVVVETRAAGELEALLGDRLLTVEELTVRGPVNEADFQAMGKSSLLGNLRNLNLKNAEIEGCRIPEYAFFCEDYGTLILSSHIRLREIILPDDVVEIGKYAFDEMLWLERVNFPKSLRKIGEYAFSSCRSLGIEPLVFNEGLEEIGDYSFERCGSLSGIVLPSTLKKIGQSSFEYSGLEFVSFQDGITEIGPYAFNSCNRLKSAVLPNSLRLLGDGLFFECKNLERIVFPKGFTKIPASVAYGCLSLCDIGLPSTVEEIEQNAFACCSLLENVVLPELLTTIGYSAFQMNCRMKELVIPRSVLEIGSNCFKDLTSLKFIKCMATTPPDYAGISTPFGDIDDIYPEEATPRDIPVYVPRGSAAAYRGAPGWDYFTNFVEVDEFPEAGVGEAGVGEAEPAIKAEAGRIVFAGGCGSGAADYAVYSLDGRLVAAGRADSAGASVDVPSGLYLARRGGSVAKVAVP